MSRQNTIYMPNILLLSNVSQNFLNSVVINDLWSQKYRSRDGPARSSFSKHPMFGFREVLVGQMSNHRVICMVHAGLPFENHRWNSKCCCAIPTTEYLDHRWIKTFLSYRSTKILFEWFWVLNWGQRYWIGYALRTSNCCGCIQCGWEPYFSCSIQFYCCEPHVFQDWNFWVSETPLQFPIKLLDGFKGVQ